MQEGSLPTGDDRHTLLVSMSRMLTSADLGFATKRYAGDVEVAIAPDRAQPARFPDLRRVVGINRHHRIPALSRDKELASIGLEAHMIGTDRQRKIHIQAAARHMDRSRTCAD